MTTTTITLDDFNAYTRQLASHDWTYDYSDDQRVWRRGHAELVALKAQAQKHALYQQAYDLWASYVWREPQVSEQAARDQREHALQKLRIQLAS